MNKPCIEINKQIGQLFTCSETKNFIQISTPFLYPDGDVIDVFYREIEDGFILTDLGETSRWLESQSITGFINKKQEELTKRICLNHKLEFKKDMIIGRYNNDEKLAYKIIKLGQSIVEISSLWVLQTPRKTRNIVDVIEDFIKETEINYQREQKYVGMMDRKWRPHFYTTFRGNNTLTHVLNAEKRGDTRNLVCIVNTQWEDLERYRKESNFRFISLIVDTKNDQKKSIWTKGDEKFLQRTSYVKKWSNKNEFKKILMAA